MQFRLILNYTAPPNHGTPLAISLAEHLEALCTRLNEESAAAGEAFNHRHPAALLSVWRSDDAEAIQVVADPLPTRDEMEQAVAAAEAGPQDADARPARKRARSRNS